MGACRQVSAGMWRRNGLPMLNQIVNYAAAPLCTRLRDLDLLTLQLCLKQLLRAEKGNAAASGRSCSSGSRGSSGVAAAAVLTAKLQRYLTLWKVRPENVRSAPLSSFH